VHRGNGPNQAAIADEHYQDERIREWTDPAIAALASAAAVAAGQFRTAAAAPPEAADGTWTMAACPAAPGSRVGAQAGDIR